MQRIELEKEFKARMAAELAKSTAEQTIKEKALIMSAEADKSKALEEIQKQNETALFNSNKKDEMLYTTPSEQTKMERKRAMPSIN